MHSEIILHIYALKVRYLKEGFAAIINTANSMLGKMKLRKALIRDKLDTLKQASVLLLDPVYKEIVKCGY